MWDVSRAQPEGLRKRIGQEAHRRAAVVWNSKLSVLLGLRIGMQLSYLEDTCGMTGEKPLIIVGFALKRLAGPFLLFLREFLGTNSARRMLNLNRLGADEVAVRLPNDTTGPHHRAHLRLWIYM